MLKKLVLMSVVFVLALSGAAQATLLVAGDFTYSDGDLAGNNGGYSAGGGDGWSGAWVNWSGGAAPADELVVSGNELAADIGISVLLGVERFIDSTQGETTQYFGFDLKHYAPVSSETRDMFGLGIDVPPGGGPELLAAGSVTGAGWSTYGLIKTGGVGGPTVYATGAWHRVVGRLVFNKDDGLSEVLTVWVNPALETDTPQVTTPDGSPHPSSQDMGITTLDGLSLVICGKWNGGATPAWGLDRLNLTTTFAEARDGIIPEPATMLVLLGGGLLAMIRRR